MTTPSSTPCVRAPSTPATSAAPVQPAQGRRGQGTTSSCGPASSITTWPLNYWPPARSLHQPEIHPPGDAAALIDQPTLCERSLVAPPPRPVAPSRCRREDRRHRGLRQVRSGSRQAPRGPRSVSEATCEPRHRRQPVWRGHQHDDKLSFKLISQSASSHAPDFGGVPQFSKLGIKIDMNGS